jgi:hypothetical protein
MADTAAHLVDHVLPHVAVRQWVLTLPIPLRYRVAFDHEIESAILGLFLRTVFTWLRVKARENGVTDPRPGAVTIVQRAVAGDRRGHCSEAGAPGGRIEARLIRAKVANRDLIRAEAP